MGKVKGGHTNETGKMLCGYIERIERINEEISSMQDDRKQVFAEVEASGFDTKTLRRIIKLRAIDASERAEADALLDTYMHAIGMAEPPELFRHVGLMSVDHTARASVVDAMGPLVPEGGEMIVKTQGGISVRLWRNDEGVQVEDYVPPAATTAATTKRGGADLSLASAKEGPSLQRAREMGREAGREKSAEPNPFKKGDIRRGAWDEQYRLGMAEADNDE